MNYWEECIAEAMEDAGITATDEQVKTVADWVDGAHENYGMAHGHDCIPNPLGLEVDNLKIEMKKLKASHERQINGVVKGVAQRRNVDVNQVSIDDEGLVTYRR